MIDGTCSLFAALELPFYEKVRTFDQQYKTDDETDKHKSKRGVVDEIFHVFLLCFPSIYSKIVSLTEAGFTHYPQKKTHVYQGTSDMRYTGDSSIYMSLII